MEHLPLKTCFQGVTRRAILQWCRHIPESSSSFLLSLSSSFFFPSFCNTKSIFTPDYFNVSPPAAFTILPSQELNIILIPKKSCICINCV